MSDLAVLFPGQGAQKVGMGKDWAERSAPAREIFEEADRVLGYSLSRLCFEGPAEDLNRTEHAQPAIFVTSLAAIAACEHAGTLKRSEVGAVAGLSLGEYTALAYAGAFDFAGGLRLVRTRGRAMQSAAELEPSGMVTLLGADRAMAEKLCDAARASGVLVVANLNAPGQVVLAGDRAACGRAVEMAKTVGVKRAIPLVVAGAFHSPLMEPARAALKEALAQTRVRAPDRLLVSNVTAAKVSSADEVRQLLAEQVCAPVRFEESLRTLHDAGVRCFVEPPPGDVLGGLAKKTLTDIETRSLAIPGEGA